MAARTKVHWSRLSDEEIERFEAHLDSRPEQERPLYAISGRKSSLWEKLGGGTRRIIVLFYRDRVVISDRGMVSTKEKGHKERPIASLEGVKILSGPLFSSVALRFSDGLRTKLVNIRHQAADPVGMYEDTGLAAFDRARLTPEAKSDFFYACNVALDLPENLFTPAV